MRAQRRQSYSGRPPNSDLNHVRLWARQLFLEQQFQLLDVRRIGTRRCCRRFVGGILSSEMFVVPEGTEDYELYEIHGITR